MQSVLEVNKRRETRKQPLTRFLKNPARNINNCSNGHLLIQGESCDRIRKYKAHPFEYSNQKDSEPWSPMMPVLLIAKKRAKVRSNPPGLSYQNISNSNNNSKKATENVKDASSATVNNSSKTKHKGVSNDRKTKEGKSGGTQSGNKSGKRSTSKGNTSDKEKRNSMAVKKNPIIECITALKSDESVPYLAKLTPDCLRGKDSEVVQPVVKIPNTLNVLKNFIKPKPQIEHIKVYIIKVNIAGEITCVNVFNDIADEDTECALFLDDRLTPENYEQTSQYYDHEIERRLEVKRSSQILGYMLEDGMVEGDKDEWVAFTEKCREEEKEWRAKCRESDAYFTKTGKIIGQDVSRYTKAVDYLSGAVQIIKKACPCLMGGR